MTPLPTRVALGSGTVFSEQLQEVGVPVWQGGGSGVRGVESGIQGIGCRDSV